MSQPGPLRADPLGTAADTQGCGQQNHTDTTTTAEDDVTMPPSLGLREPDEPS